MQPFPIVGIAGSLRAGSHSQAVLDTLRDMLPPYCSFDRVDIGALPHYSADLESRALPAAVADARARVNAAAAVIITLPEYNHGVPGVLKNTLDWLSRPVRASCMLDKPVLFATQSAGALGGVRAQSQLRETLASMLCQLVPMPEIVIGHADAKITNGRVIDPDTLSHLRARLYAFLDAIGGEK